MSYDVVVIGSGHAGCEAALAAARMGLRTAVVTLRLDRVAFMPCNPAIGGLGKGHLVREVDALGGQMARAIDVAGIQFRMLNRSKGPAVWSPRAQADKAQYSQYMLETLQTTPNLDLLQGCVEQIITEKTSSGRIKLRAIRVDDGKEIETRALVITTGTFLRGLMHTGCDRTPGGRQGETAATALSRSFLALGFTLGRLKTGTPPRLLRDSIDFSRFEEQPGDDPPRPFSHATQKLELDQVPCHIAHTTEKLHKYIRDHLHLAPMFNGQVQSTGPRYCPSIEDKVVRFADRKEHHLFLEPEGRESPEIYVNGLSTSMPSDIQRRIVEQIPGLEQAEILRFGYAVEYDYVPSGQVRETMETRAVDGLYLAGQINGTSGYEEAAAQGLVAGINAAAKILQLEEFVLSRSEAYVGVMVDDLVHKKLTEPYRMFTSRAEFRLQLRIDNADERLMPYAERYGLMDDDVRRIQQRNAKQLAELRKVLSRSFNPSEIKEIAAKTGAKVGLDNVTLSKLLKTPGVALKDLVKYVPSIRDAHPDVLEKLEVGVRYEGYIRRQQREINAVSRLEERRIPAGLDFKNIFGLSTEAVERLHAHQPRNLACAGRLEGVRAADLTLLLVYLDRKHQEAAPMERQAASTGPQSEAGG